MARAPGFIGVRAARRRSYPIDRLIERYGIDAKLFDFEPEADCPRKIRKNPYDACGARGNAALWRAQHCDLADSLNDGFEK
jgi:hypothetical protein